MPRALLSLGSNLGDREQALRDALQRLDAPATTRVVAVSSWWATAPAGGPPGQGEFFNAAAIVETQLSPLELLDQLLAIEQLGGRQRLEHWSARTLDIDLLLYDEQVVRHPRLAVPHPRFAYRRFALEPAAEIAGDWRHPVIDWTIGQLAEHARSAPLYVSLRGLDSPLLARLADQLASRERLLGNAGENDATSKITFRSEPYELSEPGDSRPGVAEVLAPRLLVLVETGDSTSDGTEQASGLRRAVTRPGRGPWLILDGSQPERCLAELVGAVEALRDGSVRRLPKAGVNPT